MRLVATVVVLGVVFASASGTPSAHHSFASQFDDRVAVTLHGVIASAEMINPHSFIHIDVKTPDGAMERWALEGPGPLQISRRGLAPDVFKPGESLGVCGYLAKNGSRVLQAAVLIMPTGDKLLWHNYRQRKCDLDQ